MQAIRTLAVLFSAALIFFATGAGAQTAAKSSPLIVGFVGDSIMSGVGARYGSAAGKGGGPYEGMATDAISVVWRRLPHLGGRAMPMADISPFAVPGTTALNWMANYGRAKDGPTGWNAFPPDLFMVMFGPNDANSGDSPSAYLDHLKALADTLRADFPKAKIILNAPLWIDQAKASAEMGYKPDAAALVEQYVKALKAKPSFIDGVTVFLGDTDAHDRFMEADKAGSAAPPLTLADGVHPNDAGHKLLGEYWVAAIEKVLAACHCGPGP